MSSSWAITTPARRTASAARGGSSCGSAVSCSLPPPSRSSSGWLAAKRDLRLAAELKRLDRFEALILDELGYMQQSRKEMETLFTLLAERYERRSVVITSNLVLSQWDQIFKDPMTTTAAVDRMVHHAMILELPIPSYRAQVAKARSQASPIAEGT